jgi:hypothetical protein
VGLILLYRHYDEVFTPTLVEGLPKGEVVEIKACGVNNLASLKNGEIYIWPCQQTKFSITDNISIPQRIPFHAKVFL